MRCLIKSQVSENPEIDSVGQSTPSGKVCTCIDRAIKYGQADQRGACVRVKTRYPEKFKINISTLCRIQTKLYMKALEYKTYFIHIDSEQILKSLEDIQVFFSI
jgi:hypothetical protein